jgi:hypothetical protein
MAKQRVSIPKTIRDQVLKEYAHRCAMCGTDRPEIHHIDEDPSNNHELNLIPLCPNCHTNVVHTPFDAVEVRKLQLFRKYRHQLILAPQFHPIFTRLVFLDDVGAGANWENLRIRIVKAQEKGDFYGGEISRLLAFHPFNASFSIPFGGSVPKWYVDEKNKERPKYIEQVCQARERVYDLIIEMLAFQNWKRD